MEEGKRQLAMISSFIRSVGSYCQCIESIRKGDAIVFKNNGAYT